MLMLYLSRANFLRAVSSIWIFTYADVHIFQGALNAGLTIWTNINLSDRTTNVCNKVRYHECNHLSFLREQPFVTKNDTFFA